MSSSWVGALLLLLGLLAAPAALADEDPGGTCEGTEPCSGTECEAECDSGSSTSSGPTASASVTAGPYGASAESTGASCWRLNPWTVEPSLWPSVLGVLTLNTNCISITYKGP